jgi:YVTN family beta-propeller protein
MPLGVGPTREIMKPNTKRRTQPLKPILASASLALAFTGCMHDAHDEEHEHGDHTHLTLYVGGASQIAAYDLASGEQKAGEITDVGGLTDMQILEDGSVIVNSGTKNQIVVFDGATMLEKNRIASSNGGLKPTHSFLSTPQGGKQFYAALLDGSGTRETNGMLLIDATPSSANYLKRTGEAPLGIGHHKAAMSKSKARMSVSNIGDCSEIVTVLDFSDPANIATVAKVSAADLGFDGSSKEKTCGTGGVSLSPHGSATAPVSGRAYHNLTGIGKILSIDQDAAAPKARLLDAKGKGAGYTKALAGTNYVYSLQNNPREGSATHPGAVCQVGQIVVIDGGLDSVVNEVPVFLTGPDCKDSLPKVEKSTGLDHMTVIPSVDRIYVLGGNSDTAGYSNHRHIFDISDPKNPKQLPSLTVGKSRGHHPETLTGDGKYLVEGDNLDNTVTVIDVAAGKVVKTIPVVKGPSTLSSWGTEEGPSHHVGPVE